MSKRLARHLVRLYPRVWRARYEDEFVALLEARDLGWRELLDVGRGAGREWIRLTLVGRVLAVGLEVWITAIAWSLMVASIGSLIVGVLRFVLGFESTITLPFLSLELAGSFVVQIPAAIALAAAVATPWFLMSRVTGFARRLPIVVRLISLVPAIAVCATFVFSAEQSTGVVAAAWVLSGHAVASKARAVA